jgi:rare lipoprotein A
VRHRVLAIATLVILSYGCATTRPVVKEAEVLRGIASWYGEEFAGRTTANGEIFDPAQLTAAHRTMPFGTLLEIRNPATSQMVLVRINDRGPYVGNRLIDLSYAAAKQIGLIEPGIGNVEIKVLKVGSGEREPPAPFDVTIAEAPATRARSAGDPPEVEFPLPGGAPPSGDVVERVDVEIERAGVATRRQVSADGRGIEEVPVEGAVPGTRRPVSDVPPRATSAQSVPPTDQARVTRRSPQFIVQAGAFSVEENANRLRDQLIALGQRPFVDHDKFYRVRIGPFETREEAVGVRSALEARGVSAMILSE